MPIATLHPLPSRPPPRQCFHAGGFACCLHEGAGPEAGTSAQCTHLLPPLCAPSLARCTVPHHEWRRHGICYPRREWDLLSKKRKKTQPDEQFAIWAITCGRVLGKSKLLQKGGAAVFSQRAFLTVTYSSSSRWQGEWRLAWAFLVCHSRCMTPLHLVRAHRSACL